MIYLVRVFHGLISAFFLVCLSYLYYAGLTNRTSIWSTLAAVALLTEGVILVLNNWECPLGHLHNRYDDPKTFFELLLPKRIAKHVIPTMSVLALIGLGLLIA